MNRAELDNEWERVRIAPSTFAADRYSWLRPAASGSIGAADGAEPPLFLRSLRSDGTWRFRALRVDEAHAVLDIQFAIDDLHPLDRSKMGLRRYYFHEDTLQLNLSADPLAFELMLLATAQNLGVRYWWACPACGGRRRYLYYYRLGDCQRHEPSAGVLGCRQCLGLTYRSRARNRCDDYDRQRAVNGDLEAAARVLSRIVQRQHSDEVLVERLRRKLHVRATNLANAGREPNTLGHAQGRQR